MRNDENNDVKIFLVLHFNTIFLLLRTKDKIHKNKCSFIFFNFTYKQL